MPKLNVIPYTPEWEQRWDRFVMEDSQNGTFLQTRRFLNYHPAGRFTDASLVFAMDNGEIVAAVPAAAGETAGETCFRSHPGSTFGGMVLAKRAAQADKVIGLVQSLDEWIAARYLRSELKITPAVFATQPTALLEYALFYCGYTQETELATYRTLVGQTPDLLRASYSATKRYELKRCQAKELTSKRLETDEELAEFYALLTLNMQKFNTTPVHTLAEITDFVRARLKDEIYLFGVRDTSGAMVAAACLFYFKQTNTLHTQYLAADNRVSGYAPSAFLYDCVLCESIALGADALSFGTSTFEHGHVLNTGLIQNKEGYGCEHALNRLFSKRFLP